MIRGQLVRRALIAFIFACFTNVSVLAQTQTAVQSQSQPQPTINPETMFAKTVFFIHIPYKDKTDGKIEYMTGTCFELSLPDTRIKNGFGYIVTNRHVAEAEGQGEVQPYVYIDANLSNGKSQDVKLSAPMLLSSGLRWYFPTDPTVDLAVLPGVPVLKDKQIDALAIPISMLATNDVWKAHHIGIGDEVSFVGFFYQFSGVDTIDPIYRTGTIAMTPSDPINMADDPNDENKATPEHLYLADAHAFLGNSGSPLFINVGGARHGTLEVGSQYYLLGIVNGYLPESTDGTVTGAVTLEGGAKRNLPNSGILTFIPAQELSDFLYSPELTKRREDIIAAQKK